MVNAMTLGALQVYIRLKNRSETTLMKLNEQLKNLSEITSLTEREIYNTYYQMTTGGVDDATKKEIYNTLTSKLSEMMSNLSDKDMDIQLQIKTEETKKASYDKMIESLDKLNEQHNKNDVPKLTTASSTTTGL